jgi:hypothetical protein
VVAIAVTMSSTFSTATGGSAQLPDQVIEAMAPTFQPANELVFTPVAPCRIADTRAGGGIMTAGSTRAFHVTGTVGFAPAGGKSGGCGVPAGAVAAVLSVTTTSSTGIGFLTLYANGAVRPAASQASYRAGDNVTSQVDAPLGADGAVRVYSSGTTHVVLDVSGYYVKQLAAFISPSGGTYAGSSRVTSSARITDPGVYEVTFDRDVRYCSSVATPYYYNYYASTDSYGAASNNTIRVRLWTNAGVAVNGYFSLTVSC